MKLRQSPNTQVDDGRKYNWDKDSAGTSHHSAGGPVGMLQFPLPPVTSAFCLFLGVIFAVNTPRM